MNKTFKDVVHKDIEAWQLFVINLVGEVNPQADGSMQQPHVQHHPHPHPTQTQGISGGVAAYLSSDRFRLYLIAFAIYTVITLVMFWYVTIHIASSVPNGAGDVYQSMWNLWWTPYAIFSLHASPYFTSTIFFPVGANLVTQDLSPLAGIISAPFQRISLALAYNLVFLFSFILSGLFAFMLLFHLTKNKYASFLGGLVFAFSPMHVAQAIGHLNWASIEFIPLFILLFMLMVKEAKLRYVVGAALSFLFIVFFGDPLQGIITIVFILLFAILYLLITRRKELLNRGAAIRFVEMIVIVMVLGSPFLIPIAGGLLSPATLSTANQLSGPVNQMLYSDNLASYFLPSYYNGIFHGLSLSYYNTLYGLIYQNTIYTPNVTEKVSYMGYSVLLLALIALYFDFRKHRLGKTAIWLALLLIFGWLSLGPTLQLLGNVTGIPAIYAIYSSIPLFNLIREPGRFDLIVTLCLAVLSAMGFAYLTEGRKREQVILLAAVFFVLIMIEYNSIPLSSSFATILTANATIPKAYHQLGALQGNFSVLELPILANANSSSPELYPAIAMYYATAMNGKPILGGYASRQNDSQTQSVAQVPLASAAQYLEEGYGFVYPSPVVGNVTNESLLWLANYNTQFITVTRSAYTTSEQAPLYNYLYGVFGQPVYADNSTFVFGTRQDILAHAGKALTAYPIGTWIPGYTFCGGTACNATFGTMWWGSNVRGIVLFAPNSMQVKMNLTAVAALNGTRLSLYLNNTRLGNITLRSTPGIYTAKFNVSAGYSQLVLYTPNNTAIPSSYLLYGAKNITFTRA